LTSLPLLGEILSKPSRGGTERILRECVYDPALITEEVIAMYYRIGSLPGAQRCLLATLRAAINFLGIRPEIYRPILEDSGRITSETLIIWGVQDRILPVKHAYIGKDTIPNARLKIYDQCGHLPQFEIPEAFNQLVLDFLESAATEAGIPRAQKEIMGTD
jgi:4,5:9,10-diseco-3-hydroxy-5,9,17-trioxoandrosta-1(10),2-diene-4-oate hydrolase